MFKSDGYVIVGAGGKRHGEADGPNGQPGREDGARAGSATQGESWLRPEFKCCSLYSCG